ncbi:MAG: response regulator [Anaerolineales bacterium]|nr:response regulator [Anaerolineales bacterium]
MPHILVIDDEKLYYKMIVRALNGLGYEFSFAENGEKGLELARSSRPDLIITDVLMPKMNGFEVTKLLRREPRFALTPILVLTAQADLQDKLKSFEAGADDFLTKPFEPVELAARISALYRKIETISLLKGASLEKQDQASLVAVHSLRGGTGSSSLAVNLAVCFAQIWSRSSMLLDLSMMAGQIALMLNAALKRTWADVASYNSKTLDVEILQTVVAQHESSVEFIAAPTFPTDAEIITGDTLNKAFTILGNYYDYIVADLPHDFCALSLTALNNADLILVPIGSDMASVRAAAAAIKTYEELDYPADKIKVILSMAYEHGLSKDKIEAALNKNISMKIPYDPELFLNAINYGDPFVFSKPKNQVSSLLEDFTFYISKPTHKKSKPRQPSEAWKRVYKRAQARKSPG